MTDTNVEQTPAAAESNAVTALAAGFFNPTDAGLTAAQSAIDAAIAAAAKVGAPVVQNFAEDAELPDGFGIVVRPVTARAKSGEAGKTLRGVVVGFAPTLETLLGCEQGAAFVREIVESALSDKLVAAVRGRDDAPFGGVMPATLAEFLTRATRSSGLEAYRAVAELFVAAIRSKQKKGAKPITIGTLRMVCESAAYASSAYGAIPQATWVSIIQTMRSKAVALNESPAIFDQWLATRDKVEFDMGDLSLDAEELAALAQ